MNKDFQKAEFSVTLLSLLYNNHHRFSICVDVVYRTRCSFVRLSVRSSVCLCVCLSICCALLCNKNHRFSIGVEVVSSARRAMRNFLSLSCALLYNNHHRLSIGVTVVSRVRCSFVRLSVRSSVCLCVCLSVFCMISN